ncbi:hypothetical protein Glove_53g42 [Diversispora epigaea]|uniref:Uncharacterized protein n=1 Tax=Diversispora epigaea TaxID=1348612 RepID=A0A397JF94_9GLOM|nr:hypothetical protein Glove_53g42 [Diversispora epigaea]
MSHFITSPFSNRISNFSTLTNSQITFALPLTPIDFTSNSPLSKKSRTIENNNNNITSFKENNDKKFEILTSAGIKGSLLENHLDLTLVRRGFRPSTDLSPYNDCQGNQSMSVGVSMDWVYIVILRDR